MTQYKIQIQILNIRVRLLERGKYGLAKSQNTVILQFKLRKNLLICRYEYRMIKILISLVLFHY